MKNLYSALIVTVVMSTLSIGSASAATLFTTTLSGSNEVPPASSAGTGFALVSLTGDSLSVSISFSGLSSPDAAGHIHCCGPIGVNEPIAVPFTGFPVGVTGGNYNATFDLTLSASYSSAFLSAYGGTASSAEAALIAGLNAGQSYANVHTLVYPGGEIRGQLAPVPEPGTFLLGGIALGAIATLRRRVTSGK